MHQIICFITVHVHSCFMGFFVCSIFNCQLMSFFILSIGRRDNIFSFSPRSSFPVIIKKPRNFYDHRKIRYRYILFYFLILTNARKISNNDNAHVIVIIVVFLQRENNFGVIRENQF
jgi:hypothetical protein